MALKAEKTFIIKNVTVRISHRNSTTNPRPTISPTLMRQDGGRVT